MPKRVIDFDAMWASDKIAACAEWAQAEYAWLYGLADCAGCFELTNLRVIWGRVAAIRRNFSIERLEQVLDEFHDKRLLFIWSENGKRYGHWTGSDVPGRLPPPSWRNRLERLAPAVPREQLEIFLAEGIAPRNDCAREANNLRVVASPVRAEGPPLKPRLEPAPAQDLNLDLDLEGKWSEKTHTTCVGGQECVESQPQSEEQNRASESKTLFSEEQKKRSCLGKDLSANSKSSSDSNSKSEANAPPLRSGAGYNGPPAPEALAEIWDEERRSLPEVRGLTPERVARCRERIANARKGPGENANDCAQFLADFREAVRRAAATPFLCGAGPAGWRANFDWIVANDTNYLKVLEGRYDPGARAAGNDSSGARESVVRAGWSSHASARDDAARRMAHAGTGPQAHPSVRVRANVLNRAQHRA